MNVGGLTFQHWCPLEDYISALSFGGLHFSIILWRTRSTFGGRYLGGLFAIHGGDFCWLVIWRVFTLEELGGLWHYTWRRYLEDDDLDALVDDMEVWSMRS